MEPEAVYWGPEYKLIVVDQLRPARWSGDEVRVPKLALKLDAEAGLLGEVFAGLLLPPVIVEGPSWAYEIVETYRRRVSAEQAADLAMRLGPLARDAVFQPSYLPVSRMHLFWRVNGCFYKRALDPQRLDVEYEQYAELVGERSGGAFRVSPRKYREVLSYYTSRLRGEFLGALAGLARRLAPGQAWPGATCNPGQPPDPGSHVSLPEGVFTYRCRVEELAEPHVGSGVECGKPSPTASSLICKGPLGSVVVKEYLRMIVKWLPAAAASRAAYRYRLSPKARLANEYRYLRLLRSVVDTPQVLAVCGDQAKAAMVRTFLEGEPVLESRDPEPWRASGEALAAIHEAGYVLGDPNPGNFIFDGERVGLIDAEQATLYHPKRAAWDLTVYTIYALAFRAPEDLVSEGLRAYASGRNAKPEAEMLEKPSFWAPLTPLGPLALRARRLLIDALTAGEAGRKSS